MKDDGVVIRISIFLNLRTFEQINTSFLTHYWST